MNVAASPARANAAGAGVEIPFVVVGFQDLRATWREPFDAVLCLGNSFPHVLTEGAAVDSLANMRARLREGGVMILHNLNYDKRMHDQPRWFAVNSGILDGIETLIWRFADYGTDRIAFNIAVFTKNSDGQWSVNAESTPQRPYRIGELDDMLHRVGFRAIETYGNLQGEPFDAAHSGDLVLVAST